MTIFDDETVIKKAFEHASVIFNEPRALPNEIWNHVKCKTLNLILLKKSFGPTEVYVLSYISRTLHIFPRDFFQCIEQY